MSKYHDIQLTDIQLHVRKPRKPAPWYRAFMKSTRNGKPGRIETKDFSLEESGGGKDGLLQLRFPITPELEAERQKAELAGKKLRIWVPKKGLPVVLGRDTEEFLDAREKRLDEKSKEKVK